MEAGTKASAVFLSYASQDAEAAERVLEALRSKGIEVWFDRSELRGGDAWDQNIRRQIKDCALFVPIISKSTQARREGYFRFEWKLADDRTQLMAKGTRFILPVCVDDTRDSDALVPDSFTAVQWMRLPAGETPEAFCARVKKLVGELSAPATVTASRGAAAERPTVAKHRSLLRWLGVALLVGAAVTVAWLVSRAPPQRSEAAKTGAESAPASSPAPAVSEKSIAVLPLENLSPDRDNAFFADGMHDEVITALAKIHDLKVISRTSVLAYRKTEGRNLRKIAAELGVANVLEGSVQRAGSRVKVNVQLIDARTDLHLWADSFTEDVTDVFTIQAKLAAAITSALKATLSPEEKSLIGRRTTNSQEAYDFYLRARALSDSNGYGSSRGSVEDVIALYEQAVAKDPGFALAYVQLAYANGMMYWFGHLDPSPARRARAKAALDALLRLAPDLPETRLALGFYSYFCENDWARALAEFRAAEVGLPNDAQVIYSIGRAQRRLGRLAQALESFNRAVQLNPRDLSSLVDREGLLQSLRRFPEERDVSAHDLEVFPGNPALGLDFLVAKFEIDGDKAAYLHPIETYVKGADDPESSYNLALGLGDYEAAERALDDPRLTTLRGPGNVVNTPKALHRAFLAFLRGRPDEARAFANEAAAIYRAGQWSPRQEPWVMTGTAFALAFEGRADEAVRLAREALELQGARDQLALIEQRPELGRLHLVLDRRDDAFAVLREMMTGPCEITPMQVRLDPLWSRLKDDPRFEEILKSAKPMM
jgi:TolB-like protein